VPVRRIHGSCTKVLRWTLRSAAIAVLVLALPASGPVINAHLLLHEVEASRDPAQIPPHDHTGEHLEPGAHPPHALYCPSCLSFHGSALLAEAPAIAGIAEPCSTAPTARERDPHPFHLFGPGAPRAPPA
jgi:hypothetical protein